MPFDTFKIYFAFGIGCFLIAIIFFREENKSFNKVFLPFMMGILTPSKMRIFLKKEGIYFVVLGYLSFIVGLIVF